MKYAIDNTFHRPSTSKSKMQIVARGMTGSDSPGIPFPGQPWRWACKIHPDARELEPWIVILTEDEIDNAEWVRDPIVVDYQCVNLDGHYYSVSLYDDGSVVAERES